MPCYRPLHAFQCADGEIVFCERAGRDTVRALQLACGQCIGCRLERSRQWAIRCMHEASLYKNNSFLTLTYGDGNIPAGQSLCYPDYQLFMKRLRKHAGATKLRFYMCGEYGELFGRPHYHACIFNLHFPDQLYWSKSPGGSKIYRSKTLEKLWPLGFSSIGAVNFQSAAYVARYCMKKITGAASKEHYQIIDPETGEITQRQAEFNRMSLRKGIGAKWIEQYKTDVYPKGKVVVNGHETNPPRYYDKQYAEMDPLEHEQLIFGRYLEGEARKSDNTAERLKVKETVAAAKIRHLKRTIQ